MDARNEASKDLEAVNKTQSKPLHPR